MEFLDYFRRKDRTCYGISRTCGERIYKKRDEVKARLSHNPEIKENRLPFEVTMD